MPEIDFDATRFSKAVVKEVNEEERSFVAYASTGAVDRENEIIDPSGWKYKQNNPILFSHDWMGPAVGKTLWVKHDKKGLKFKGQFAPTAQGLELYTLYSQGYMDSFSVGFKSILREVPEDTTQAVVHKEVELYEISAVAIPANPEAVIESIKSGKIKDKALIKALEDAMPEGKTDHTEKPGWDETETSFRHRLRNPDDFEKDSFRTITLPDTDPKVKAIVGKLKGEDSMTMQALIFEKADGWTMDDAKAWVEDHPNVGKALIVMLFKELDEAVKAVEEAINLDESIEIPDESIEIPEEGIEIDDGELAKAIKEASAKRADIVIATRKGKVIVLE